MSTLVLTSDTLIGTPSTGNLEYNGQFFGTDSNASRAQLQRIVRATAVASTSGTSIDFTNIPAWVERITVLFSGVSLSASANFLIQLGVSGTPETSGYTSVGNVTTAAGVAQVTSTAGFIIYAATASYLQNGAVRLHNITGNTWVADGVLCNTTAQNYTAFVAGSKALAGVANMVRITSTSTDTFDAGSVNIIYEG
jgi:hypothetical protein